MQRFSVVCFFFKFIFFYFWNFLPRPLLPLHLIVIVVFLVRSSLHAAPFFNLFFFFQCWRERSRIHKKQKNEYRRSCCATPTRKCNTNRRWQQREQNGARGQWTTKDEAGIISCSLWSQSSGACIIHQNSVTVSEWCSLEHVYWFVFTARWGQNFFFILFLFVGFVYFVFWRYLKKEENCIASLLR